MPTERLPPDHPDSAEHAPVRAELARLYIRHSADMALDLSDEELIARTSEITNLLFALTHHARLRDDQAWLARHRWFIDACERLIDDERAAPLDG
jgi:hypothetical protein